MGYFSNGTEGELYYNRWCATCVHDLEDRGCPIWDLHLLFNYDFDAKIDTDDGFTLTLGNILNEFIPRSKDGLFNEECKMYIQDGGKP